MKDEMTIFFDNVAERLEYEYRKTEMVKIKSHIEDFIMELDQDELGKTVATNVEHELRVSAVEVRRLEDAIKRWAGIPWIVSFLEEQLVVEKANYKKIYIRLGNVKSVYGGVEKNSGKLTESELDDIRSTPIENFLPGGVQLLNAGNGRKKCTCPFHREKTPSFTIFENNSFYCFGCNKGGANAIDFVMVRDNCSFIEALRKLKR